MIYEFRCEGCGTSTEVRATLTEKEKGLKPVCPNCGSKNMKQVVSTFGIGARTGGNGFSNFSGCTPGGGCCG